MVESEYNIPERYQAIERANERSWYFDDATPRPFEVYQSVGTVKPSERVFGEGVLRKTLAGNMSPIYGEGDEDERFNQSLENMQRFYFTLGDKTSTGIEVADLQKTKLLYPQRPRIEKKPLQMLNADQYDNPVSEPMPLILPERADFIYTYSKETILAARPADCPVVLATAHTPKGEILMLTHFSWEVIADGSMGVMFDHYDSLGVDRDSLRMYVTPGGHAESFPYTNYPEDPRQKFAHSEGLFVNVRPNADDPENYDFEIDTPHFAYDQLLSYGMQPKQIYADTSDTSQLDSGYSSHGRAARSNGKEENIRDIILAKMN